jgi:DNA-binding beta-propeller fold protein YncE
VDIAWMQDGGERQAGALAILDRDGLLIQYDPTWEGLEYQAVGGTDQWRAPLSLHTYGANLYVLDPMASQVFKYQSGSFGEAPSRWIADSETDLATVIDMGIDGNIYLLHNTGRVAKYYGGEPTAFTLTRIPRPLTGANALHADVEEAIRYIYIADASERRIVQIDREGAFVRQLQPALGQEESFRQLSGLFVDETGGKLYLVAANTLYVTDLSPVQQ